MRTAKPLICLKKVEIATGGAFRAFRHIPRAMPDGLVERRAMVPEFWLLTRGMAMKRLISGCVFLFISLFGIPAHAGPMAHFELTCTGCATGGDFTRSWDTPFEATTAPGYANSVPGAFFVILIPELGASFYAHSATYPNGYTYYDGLQAAMAGPSASLIFDGPTSAPVWKVGEYDDVVNYFTATDQGRAHLSITAVAVAVPEPASLALVGLALAAAATSRRGRVKPV